MNALILQILSPPPVITHQHQILISTGKVSFIITNKSMFLLIFVLKHIYEEFYIVFGQYSHGGWIWSEANGVRDSLAGEGGDQRRSRWQLFNSLFRHLLKMSSFSDILIHFNFTTFSDSSVETEGGRGGNYSILLETIRYSNICLKSLIFQMFSILFYLPTCSDILEQRMKEVSLAIIQFSFFRHFQFSFYLKMLVWFSKYQRYWHIKRFLVAGLPFQNLGQNFK